MDNEIYTIDEVAEKFRVTKWTVYRLIKSHKLGAHKIAGQWRVTQSEIDRYMRDNHSK